MDSHQFILAAQGCAVLALVLAVLTLVFWIRQASVRFAFVGYTAFSVVLAVGCFALSLGPIMRTVVPGAVAYTTVFDRGSDMAVITVPASINPQQLEKTLEQAASNLFSSGRYSSRSRQFTIRARAVLHPQPDITLPLYLGQLTQSMGLRMDPNRQIELFPKAFAQAQAVLAQPS